MECNQIKRSARSSWRNSVRPPPPTRNIEAASGMIAFFVAIQHNANKEHKTEKIVQRTKKTIDRGSKAGKINVTPFGTGRGHCVATACSKRLHSALLCADSNIALYNTHCIALHGVHPPEIKM
jgi:hypothetical protein